MAKASFLVFSAVLLFLHGVCEGLECYHCYSSKGFENKGPDFVSCNEANLSASNTFVSFSPNTRCIYKVLEIASTKQQQIWRTYSTGVSDPCDPNMVPPGMKMLKCTHCGTDKCNLNEGEPEKEKNSFTFNINANVNLFIRQ